MNDQNINLNEIHLLFYCRRFKDRVNFEKKVKKSTVLTFIRIDQLVNRNYCRFLSLNRIYVHIDDFGFK